MRVLEKNIYKPIRARLERVIEETAVIKSFVIRPEEPFAFETGQFVELSVPGLGEAPFTPSSSPEDTSTLEFTIMRAGSFTASLHSMRPAQQLVGIRGPLGVGYPLQRFAGKDVLILGGGVGLAPLRSLIYALLARRDQFGRIILCYGARTPQDIVYKELLAQWKQSGAFEIYQSIDRPAPEWTGTVGVVTVLLKEVAIAVERTVAVVCGPPIMMKFGTLELLKLNVAESAIYLSMEKNMSCGFGKCGHCQLGKFFCCKDGPVFTYDQIKDIHNVWD